MDSNDNVIPFPALSAGPLLPPAHLHDEAQQAWIDIAGMAPRLARNPQALERAAVLLAHYRETRALSPSLTGEMNALLAELRGPSPVSEQRRYRRGARPGGNGARSPREHDRRAPGLGPQDRILTLFDRGLRLEQHPIRREPPSAIAVRIKLLYSIETEQFFSIGGVIMRRHNGPVQSRTALAGC